MNEFALTTVSSIIEAKAAIAKPGTALLAGGTTLIDLWKLGAYPVENVIDINNVPMRGIQAKLGSLTLGALEKMSDVGSHFDVAKYFPVVSQALLLSASPQIRNMGSMGGNLLQRPRSISYRSPDPTRRDGPSRYDAIFGVTPVSRAVHPSDLAVALIALDTVLHFTSNQGDRTVALADFYHTPDRALSLWSIRPDEMITSIELTGPAFSARSAYIKIRDRASYQFALVSAAVAIDLDSNGTINDARIAAGGVATIPWRFKAVEDQLRGKPANDDTFVKAVANVGNGAQTHADNAYKVELLKRTIHRALREAQRLS